ncbi:MAG: succinate dehydrogenase assembly factor 4 [Pseudomonadota bacterium]
MQQTPKPSPVTQAQPPEPAQPPVEIGGPTGPEPTRFGDWERNGRCVDF